MENEKELKQAEEELTEALAETEAASEILIEKIN